MLFNELVYVILMNNRFNGIRLSPKLSRIALVLSAAIPILIFQIPFGGCIKLVSPQAAQLEILFCSAHNQ